MLSFYSSNPIDTFVNFCNRQKAGRSHGSWSGQGPWGPAPFHKGGRFPFQRWKSGACWTPLTLESRQAPVHVVICAQATSTKKGWHQIKTTTRHQRTPVRKVIVRKSTDSKFWKGCGEKGTLLHYCGNVPGITTKKRTVWWFFKKLKIELPYDPAILLLSGCLNKTIIQNIHAPLCS